MTWPDRSSDAVGPRHAPDDADHADHADQADQADHADQAEAALAPGAVGASAAVGRAASRSSSAPQVVGSSMSGLVDMMTNTLDPGYAEAAARRAAQGVPTAGRLRPLTVAAAAVAGLILVTAGVQERLSAPSAAKARTDLAAQVGKRTTTVGVLQRRVGSLAAELATLRAAELTGTTAGRELAAQLGTLQDAAGRLKVTGPAVQVTLSDATDATARSKGGQVLDTDLQHVVNAFWAGGAEAVAVNGQRVTTLTSIRAAGDAIVVDFKPVDPPYVVTGIGDPGSLEQRFVSSPEAAALRTYSQAYGLGFVVRTEAHATLPAAAAPQLYAATPAPRASTAPGGSS